MSYTEHYFQSNDELNLYYREYAGSEDRLPIICLSGLTRNSGDFHDFATRYSGERKIYTLDYRGRGKSDYDDNYSNYNPQTYLGDVFTFLAGQGIEKAIFVGTSLGGILTMALAALAPQYIGAVIINDIGPEVDSSGGARIAGYVGQDIRFSSLEMAAAAQKDQFIGAYPDLDDTAWLKTTRVSYIFDEKQKNYRPNYDVNLGKALQEQINDAENVDLWAFFEALKNVPTLAIRGVLSDVLSLEVFEKMQNLHPDMETLTLSNRGHVPLLDEPLLLEKMDEFLGRV